jgi:DNA-binding response OmpR family regulator
VADNRLLIIDDDARLAEMLVEYLAPEGIELTIVPTGIQGLRSAQRENYDLIILDVMLPGLSGFDLLKQLRESGSKTPVLMLTARGDDADRIVGLELGADDYVPKPCSPRELAARLRAILKRGRGEVASPLAPLSVGALTVYPAQRRVERDGAPIDLTSTEYNLLELLAIHAGRPVSKAELSQQALGRPLSRFDRSIDVHISSIRQKIGALPDGRSRIQTVIRQGYQLVVE